MARTIDRLGLSQRRALCERDLRRRARRHVRRGPGGGGPLVVRGLLLAGHRGHGVRRPAGGDHRGRAPRGGGRRRRDRAAGHARRPRGPGRRASAASSTTTPWRRAWERAAASGCSGRFTWEATARGTAEQYRLLLDDHRRAGTRRCPSRSPQERTDRADRRLRTARAWAAASACSTSGAAGDVTPFRRCASGRGWWPSTPRRPRWRRSGHHRRHARRRRGAGRRRGGGGAR